MRASEGGRWRCSWGREGVQHRTIVKPEEQLVSTPACNPFGRCSLQLQKTWGGFRPCPGADCRPESLQIAYPLFVSKGLLMPVGTHLVCSHSDDDLPADPDMQQQIA